MCSKWDDFIVNGGDMPMLDLPDVPPPVLDTHVHVYDCVMEEDDDGTVIDYDVCRICKKSWTELERT